MDAVTPAEIESAARKANAINFIKSFPNGFDTIVGERGLMLSGIWLNSLLVPHRIFNLKLFSVNIENFHKKVVYKSQIWPP